MADIDEFRLALAETFGLNAVNAVSDLTVLKISIDFAADATGVISVTEKLIDYAANGGSVLFNETLLSKDESMKLCRENLRLENESHTHKENRVMKLQALCHCFLETASG